MGMSVATFPTQGKIAKPTIEHYVAEATALGLAGRPNDRWWAVARMRMWMDDANQRRKDQFA